MGNEQSDGHVRIAIKHNKIMSKENGHKTITVAHPEFEVDVPKDSKLHIVQEDFDHVEFDRRRCDNGEKYFVRTLSNKETEFALESGINANVVFVFEKQAGVRFRHFMLLDMEGIANRN